MRVLRFTSRTIADWCQNDNIDRTGQGHISKLFERGGGGGGGGRAGIPAWKL